jgi:hypothetical protein
LQVQQQSGYRTVQGHPTANTSIRSQSRNTDQISYIIVTADQQGDQQEICVGEAKGGVLCDCICAIYGNLLVIVLMKKAAGGTGQKDIATAVTHSLSKDNHSAEYY